MCCSFRLVDGIRLKSHSKSDFESSICINSKGECELTKEIWSGMSLFSAEVRSHLG